MKVIIENIVGLYRFIALLLSFFVPTPKHDRQGVKRLVKEHEDKYVGIIGPSEPLIPTETKFCPKCHAAVAQVCHSERGTEIIQHGKVLITVGSIMTTQGGKKLRGFPFRCPNGHTVRIE